MQPLPGPVPELVDHEALAQDPRYTGQVFRPPYLDLVTTGFGSRPIIEDVIDAIDFGSDFMVEVTRLGRRQILEAIRP